MVEAGELGVRACLLASSALQFVFFDVENMAFSTFSPNDLLLQTQNTHQLPLTQSPSKFDERFYRPVITKFR